jgi:thiamine pyrophosphokinase
MQDVVVVVVAGGEPPVPNPALAPPLGAHVIAADGGVAHAHALELEVATVVGDLDSATSADVDHAVDRGARVERHPPEKDATDLELALDAALALSPARILVLAGDGGRLDHQLSTLSLLAWNRYSDVQVDATIGPARVHVVRDDRTLEGAPGELLSLVALHGPAEGVRTEGLVYPLAGETLEPGSSRGVSNVFAGGTARVTVERGVLLAVRPGLREESP